MNLCMPYMSTANFSWPNYRHYATMVIGIISNETTGKPKMQPRTRIACMRAMHSWRLWEIGNAWSCTDRTEIQELIPFLQVLTRWPWYEVVHMTARGFRLHLPSIFHLVLLISTHSHSSVKPQISRPPLETWSIITYLTDSDQLPQTASTDFHNTSFPRGSYLQQQTGSQPSWIFKE